MIKIEDLCYNSTFRSNCLWEAIKAKLRHGKSVRIVHMRSRDGLHHWGWVDKKSGDLYDFAQTEVVKHWIQYLRFEGYIRRQKFCPPLRSQNDGGVNDGKAD